MTNEMKLLGKRVELPTHFDYWRRGLRYGEIVSVGLKEKWIKVKLDKIPDRLCEISGEDMMFVKFVV